MADTYKLVRCDDHKALEAKLNEGLGKGWYKDQVLAMPSTSNYEFLILWIIPETPDELRNEVTVQAVPVSD